MSSIDDLLVLLTKLMETVKRAKNKFYRILSIEELLRNEYIVLAL